MKTTKFTGFIILIVISALFISACSSGSTEPDLTSPDAEFTVSDQPSGVPSGADDYYYIGTSLEGLNVCEVIPLNEIVNIVGALRENETELEISLAGEAGCKYVDQKGRWYYVTYYPLGDWEFAEYTLTDPEKIDGLLDGAWKAAYSSDEVHIKALAADEMVIGAVVSNGMEETATSLVELLYEYRPK